ncbi:nuclear transport factor 2 family protein [Sinimarinibacterium sp. NLF-5-8]|uniref:nuclear transport factor 2 family protein n=1 Tax=Sinimarinibacterium sp. NLF-5-8 TaxID=2698684 RepID=UPI00137C124F|nr:nuclear transport factor 2 family protein [Sinimarinibacterium sp. NLF-5-8]QHS11265.1 nuclear transport factor 2 family protein [Sinimarinibacterium sp. NLF-5-8]
MSSAELLQRITALEDAQAIRHLKSRYLFSCDRKDVAQMRACFADGPVDIDYGPIGQFTRADDLVEVFKRIGCHDHMVEMHHGSNPQIEVWDDQTASAKWSLEYRLINTQEHTLTLLTGYYEDGYRKVDGQWKISKTHFIPVSSVVLALADDTVKAVFAGRAAG